MFPLASGRYVYRPLREGVRGWDVVALQSGLRTVAEIVVDGVFGPATAGLVAAFQRKHGLLEDRIAGIATQREVLLANIWPQQTRFHTPAGLARGVVEGECGWQGGNYTAPYPDGTRDVGPCMLHIAIAEDSLREAFDPAFAILKLCRRLREGEPQAPYGHDDFFGAPGARSHQRAWELAVLAWNWPAGAVKLANGGALSTEPAEWVTNIGVAGVDSPAEWADHYIASKTIYVREWVA